MHPPGIEQSTQRKRPGRNRANDYLTETNMLCKLNIDGYGGIITLSQMKGEV